MLSNGPTRRREVSNVLARTGQLGLVGGAIAIVAAALSGTAIGHGSPHGHAYGHGRGKGSRGNGVGLGVCADAHSSAAHMSIVTIRAAVVCEINAQRTLHGLPPLHASPRLDRSAQRWTNEMVATDRFSHGSNLGARITAAGFRWSSAGEVIAEGYATPRGVVAGWMSSSPHCQLILSPTYAAVGTGISRHALPAYTHEGDTWTEDFALGDHRAAPSHNFAPADGCPYSDTGRSLTDRRGLTR